MWEMMSSIVPLEDAPFMEMDDPKYRFLSRNYLLELTKMKHQPNEGVADMKDQNPRCDVFKIGMVARGD